MKIHEGPESDDERWWCLSSDDTDDVPLDFTMCLASYLLEFRHTVLEVLETSNWLDGGETEVKFISPNDADRPLDVVVPELFVPVVEGFWCEESGWVRHQCLCRRLEGPIPPKGKMNTVETNSLCSWEVGGEIKWVV